MRKGGIAVVRLGVRGVGLYRRSYVEQEGDSPLYRFSCVRLEADVLLDGDMCGTLTIASSNDSQSLSDHFRHITLMEAVAEGKLTHDDLVRQW